MQRIIQGVPASSVLARGKNVLVGCEDRVVWELSRRLSPATVLRRMELGLPVLLLDAEPGRVLAAGRGRFTVWQDEAEVPPATGQCGQDATVG